MDLWHCAQQLQSRAEIYATGSAAGAAPRITKESSIYIGLFPRCGPEVGITFQMEWLSLPQAATFNDRTSGVASGI